MAVAKPHFLLTAQCRRQNRSGDWKFVVQGPDGRRLMEIEDAEPAIQGDRLELLAVVRGLEALDQPSQVTLLTGSSYVNRGLSYGMDDWRSNNWQWESHGKMVPVKNGDLWRRLDRALRVHSVRCKYHRIDNAHQNIKQRPVVAPTPQVAVPAMHNSSQLSAKSDLRRTAPAISRWWRETCSALRLRLAQLGTSLLPRPWLE